MEHDFHDQQLKGRSFQHQDLSGANFSHANISGANFSDASLPDANLDSVKAGIAPTWALLLKTGLVVAVAISSLGAGYWGTLMGDWLPEIDSLAGRIFFCLIGIGLFGSSILIIIRNGLSITLPLFLVFVSIASSIFAIFSDFNPAMLGVFVVAIWIAINTTIVIAGAITAAVIQSLLKRFFRIALLIIMLVFVALGLYLSIAQGGEALYAQIWKLWIRVGVGIPVSIICVCLSLYVGAQAIAENRKYAMIYWFAIAISNYRSTSFRNADLTNADFSNANLRQADFRNANLTRTRWHQAKFLAQARTDEEYLEDPKIRQLVVSLNGREQNFDQFDLRGLNLDGADLTDASFIGAKLSGATLKDAKLDGAKLVQAQLYGADLSGASLTGLHSRLEHFDRHYL
ncbi:MAG: pentapeptide repeat-containing protein [Cyanobacteria bacterium P01_C01_bin.73]